MKKTSYADCHGCSLCLLPCPMWRQHRDVQFSPQGFAKAMQAGATAQDISIPLSSCIMCGACDVMCPENIDLRAMITEARLQNGLSEVAVSNDTPDTAFQISCDARVQQQITQHDLYIIDATPFHAHHAQRVNHYDQLRQRSGCSMNLDLNRMAIPSGANSVSTSLGHFDVRAQIGWLTQGRSFDRIIVENKQEQDVLTKTTGKPVIHIAELMVQAKQKEQPHA
jgi:NAD-dependent dihydropyrimidine dehydrogenase PreA subunit